jgi:hypothetical protein
VSDILLIWVCGEAKYFCKGGWTGFTDLPVRQSAAPLLELRGTRPTFRLCANLSAVTRSESTMSRNTTESLLSAHTM